MCINLLPENFSKLLKRKKNDMNGTLNGTYIGITITGQ